MFEKKFTLKHVVTNFVSLTSEFSEQEKHFGVPWNLEIKKEDNFLGIFLHCRKKIEEKNPWTIDTSFKMCLTSGKEKYLESTHQFGKQMNLGWKQFQHWGSLIKNHVVNNSITIECHVTIKNMNGFAMKRKINFEEAKESWTDGVLKVGEKTFNVNKRLLAFRSPYFDTLFFGNFTESNNPEIELKDVDAKFFQNLLDAIYGESVIQAQNVEGVLKLADQYDVEMVRDKCEEVLMQTDGVGKSTKLTLAVKYDMEKLKKSCLQSITSVKDLKNSIPSDLNGLNNSTMQDLLGKLVSLQ